jgi:carbon storage regulator
MLVLSRKRDERILIADNIVITVVDIRGDKVRLGIEAPKEVPVHREEVARKIATCSTRSLTVTCCPVCGAPETLRARRPFGNATCAAGHSYPSHQAIEKEMIVPPPPPPKR